MMIDDFIVALRKTGPEGDPLPPPFASPRGFLASFRAWVVRPDMQRAIRSHRAERQAAQPSWRRRRSAVANDGPERLLAARPLPRSLRLCAPDVAESYLEAGGWASHGRHFRAAAMHCGRAPRTVTTLLTFARALGVQVGALPPQRHGDHGDSGSQQIPSRSEDWLRFVR